MLHPPPCRLDVAQRLKRSGPKRGRPGGFKVVPICSREGEAPDAQFDALLALEIPIPPPRPGDPPP